MIQSLDAQTSGSNTSVSNNCFTNQEVDYLLYQDAAAMRLRVDSAEYAAKINKFLINEAQYKANESDLKSQLKNEKRNSQEFKDDAVNMRIKYTNSETKVKRRGGIIIGSVSINVVLIVVGGAIIYFK